jgi:hypothetical protein
VLPFLPFAFPFSLRFSLNGILKKPSAFNAPLPRSTLAGDTLAPQLIPDAYSFAGDDSKRGVPASSILSRLRSKDTKNCVQIG